MSPEIIIETYLSRWSFENYFKMAKQAELEDRREIFVNEAVETVRAKDFKLMLKSSADTYFINSSLTP